MLFCLFSCTKTIDLCANPEKFNTGNSELKKRLVQSLQQKNKRFNKNTLLHKLMYEHSIRIGSGSFGEVTVLTIDGIEYVIKKVEMRSDSEIILMENEIIIQKHICELEIQTVYNTLQECLTNLIPGFFGCVKEGMFLYIFLERMNVDFESDEILQVYSNLRGKEKADIMIRIISKFEELHGKLIVHADIKPSNLMTKGIGFIDIRIIDFGYSGYLGKNYRGGTPYYAAPEHSKKGSLLSFQGDVYSLAVTFAMMESSTHHELDLQLDKKCFDFSKPTTEACANNFRRVILSSFNQDNETLQLATVMMEALKVKPSERIQSMKVFKEKILNAYSELPDLNSQRMQRVQNPTGCLGCIKRLLGIGNRPQQRILSSSSNNEFSTVFANRILAEEEAFGSKMVI